MLLLLLLFYSILLLVLLHLYPRCLLHTDIPSHHPILFYSIYMCMSISISICLCRLCLSLYLIPKLLHVVTPLPLLLTFPGIGQRRQCVMHLVDLKAKQTTSPLSKWIHDECTE